MPRSRRVVPPLHFAVPESLDFGRLEAEHPPNIPAYKRDVVAMLLHYLYESQSRRESEAPAAAPVPLRAAYLRTNVHRHVCKYLDWLVAAGVLTVRQFEKGKRPNAYALAPRLHHDRVARYRCTDWPTYRRFLALPAIVAHGKYRRRVGASPDMVQRTLDALRVRAPLMVDEAVVHAQTPLGDLPSRCHIGEELSKSSLRAASSSSWAGPVEVDRVGVAGSLPINDEQFCTGQQSREVGVVARLRADLALVTVKPSWRAFVDAQLRSGAWTLAQFNAAAIALQKLDDGLFTCRRNATNGRLDTNVTNLRRELRRFLVLDGDDRLTEIDIRASQPYLLSGLARLARDADCDAAPPADAIHEWATLVHDRDIYEELARTLSAHADRPYSRADGKAAMMRVLFSHNKDDGPEKVAFTARFPAMDRFVRALKRYPHNTCALLLQEFEAGLVIDTVCPLLLDAGVRVLTIHDSLLVRTVDAEYVTDVVRAQLTRFVGSPPVLHITAMNANSARVA